MTKLLFCVLLALGVWPGVIADRESPDERHGVGLGRARSVVLVSRLASGVRHVASVIGQLGAGAIPNGWGKVTKPEPTG